MIELDQFRSFEKAIDFVSIFTSGHEQEPQNFCHKLFLLQPRKNKLEILLSADDMKDTHNIFRVWNMSMYSYISLMYFYHRAWWRFLLDWNLKFTPSIRIDSIIPLWVERMYLCPWVFESKASYNLYLCFIWSEAVESINKQKSQRSEATMLHHFRPFKTR